MKYEIELEYDLKYGGCFYRIDGQLVGYVCPIFGGYNAAIRAAKRGVNRYIKRNAPSNVKKLNYTIDTDKGYGSVSM